MSPSQRALAGVVFFFVWTVVIIVGFSRQRRRDKENARISAILQRRDG